MFCIQFLAFSQFTTTCRPFDSTHSHHKGASASPSQVSSVEYRQAVLKKTRPLVPAWQLERDLQYLLALGQPINNRRVILNKLENRKQRNQNDDFTRVYSMGLGESLKIPHIRGSPLLLKECKVSTVLTAGLLTQDYCTVPVPQPNAVAWIDRGRRKYRHRQSKNI